MQINTSRFTTLVCDAPHGEQKNKKNERLASSNFLFSKTPRHFNNDALIAVPVNSPQVVNFD